MRNELRRACLALIPPGSHVTCAVSGGPDSMALLWGLQGLQKELDFTLSALHCHHHLRTDADADAAFVADFCDQHGIACQIHHLDVPRRQAETHESLEQAARCLRYACYEAAPGLIAVAHNAEDNLETSLIRLVRGTSPRGLSGIPASRDRIIRPLLRVSRAQILAFLDQEQIPWRQDHTNDEDFCLRNRLRHHVLPRLTAENPQLLQTWLDTGSQLRQEDAFLSQLAWEALPQTADGNGFSITKLRALHPVLQRRVLFAWLERFGVQQPRLKHLQALEALVVSDRPSGFAYLPGCHVSRDYDRIAPAREAAGFTPVTLPVPGDVRIPDIGVRICTKYLQNDEKTINSPTIFTLKCAMIGDGPLTVRPRQTGDALCLSGGHRSLKRLLIDRKIPRGLREQLPVICAGDRILAVGEIGADRACMADGAGPRLQIIIEKEARVP